MELRYNHDQLPPGRELLLYGLQWFAIALPGILIIGRVFGLLQFPDATEQVLFLQKSCLLVGLTIAVQILWGHRLPLVAGPAAVLLAGALGSQGASPAAIFTAISVGGLLLALLSAGGLFSPVQRLFTPRVIAAVLLLIAFTLTPAILRLLFPVRGPSPLASLMFASGLIFILMAAYQRLAGIWRSTLIVWGLIVGTVAHLFLFGPLENTAAHLPWIDLPLSRMTMAPVFDPGVLLSFLFCFLALAVNDVGSIQSVGEMLKAADMPARLRRGITLTGLANLLSGIFGVLGPVNFSLSPGVIAATGCAASKTLLPAAGLLCLLALSPAAVAFLGVLPDPVIGCVLLYILSIQIAAGLQVAFGAGTFNLRAGLVLGLPLLLGTIFSFLPATVLTGFPDLLRPVIGNGFVIGVASALLLEHLLLKEQV